MRCKCCFSSPHFIHLPVAESLAAAHLLRTRSQRSRKEASAGVHSSRGYAADWQSGPLLTRFRSQIVLCSSAPFNHMSHCQCACHQDASAKAMCLKKLCICPDLAPSIDAQALTQTKLCVRLDWAVMRMTGLPQPGSCHSSSRALPCCSARHALCGAMHARPRDQVPWHHTKHAVCEFGSFMRVDHAGTGGSRGV